MKHREAAPGRVLRSVVALALFSACGGPTEPRVAGPTTSRSRALAVIGPPRPAAIPGIEVLASVDESALDSSVSPCEDFYAYACGGWLKTTPIPETESAWMRSFDVISARNEELLRTVLENAGAQNAPENEPHLRPVGNFYASCMNESAIEVAADRPLAEALAKLDDHDATGVATLLAQLHDAGTPAFFNFTASQDFKDATEVIGLAEQGGLGLPERDSYVKTDAASTALRDEYQTHVARMFVLAGARPAAARQMAQAVLRIETRLARASMTKVDLRVPGKIYHRLDLVGLKRLTPAFSWEAYLSARGFPGITAINVAQPEFFRAFALTLGSSGGPDGGDAWRSYLRWHLIKASAPSLSARFVDEDFRFRSLLTGARKLLPRWKRCVRATDEVMGDALGRPFAERTLGAEGKARATAMVTEIVSAMRADLDHLAFLDGPTRARALEKLGTIASKIGFPDTWRNYDGLTIDRGSYFENVRRARAYQGRRTLAKIGKPLDRRDWSMTPSTVNASYDSSLNEITFPAGILQPPFFSSRATNGLNYGAIGTVMGHELTHGFDEEGGQFDGNGNLTGGWTHDVADAFAKRAACFTSQFDGYLVMDDLHVNGRLTLDENIADLGGVKLAFRAFVAAQGRADADALAAARFTPEQQFFLGFAQGWCANVRTDAARLRAATDPHAPPRFRVIGPLSNTPEFAEAFACAEGSPMVRSAAQRCEAW